MPPRRAARVASSLPRGDSQPSRADGSARAAPSPARVRTALLAWFDRHARDLPWRCRGSGAAPEGTSTAKPRSAASRRPQLAASPRPRRDPWQVWVSEIMLQQTRVEAVLEPYRRFVGAFPTLASLARAEQADVLARWSGLGYYRRARLLHEGARVVLERHGGEVPRTRDELERIPGIGSYTAGAILSIAFGEREAAVDANVARVVARVTATRDPRAGRHEIGRFAGALVRCDRPGDVNEALMDLGSAVCTARDARCSICPLAGVCRATAEGLASTIAAPRARKPPRRIALGCAVVRDGERVLFLRRAEDDALLASLWDLPTIDFAQQDGSPEHALKALVRRRSGLDAQLEGPLLKVRHEIVGRKIEASVYVASVRAARCARSDARMLAAADLEGVGVPALPVKILRALLRHSARAAETRAPARSP
jgi:A/G-specific adenine glycosylase